MNEGGWKFWCKRHDKLFCFIVALDERATAEQRLMNYEPFVEVLDVERVPDKVFALLDMQPNQVTGWSSLNM